jgi:NAD(P)-dependent dehydrogenase (short-subunit alcohol dehydrogenase family)
MTQGNAVMSDAERVAIVTGASRGIGAACARELAQRGYAVALLARSEPDLERVASDIRAAGQEALVAVADVRRQADLERAVTATREALGGIDVLVNNAGVIPPEKEIYDVSLEEWDDAHNILLRAPWILSSLVYPAMKERGGGSIINISSVSGLRHNEGELLYTLPKAGLIMLTKICAKEWARDNIRVNCVAPGWVRTDMSADFLDEFPAERKLNMLNTVVQTSEVAKLVAYLVAGEARPITGETIRIDAGAFGVF